MWCDNNCSVLSSPSSGNAAQLLLASDAVAFPWSSPARAFSTVSEDADALCAERARNGSGGALGSSFSIGGCALGTGVVVATLSSITDAETSRSWRPRCVPRTLDASGVLTGLATDECAFQLCLRRTAFRAHVPMTVYDPITVAFPRTPAVVLPMDVVGNCSSQVCVVCVRLSVCRVHSPSPSSLLLSLLTPMLPVAPFLCH